MIVGFVISAVATVTRWRMPPEMKYGLGRAFRWPACASPNLALRDLTWFADEVQDRERRHRFRPVFAHDTESLAGLDREAPSRFLTSSTLTPPLRSFLVEPRVQQVAQPVAQQVHHQYQDHQHDAGDHRDPPRAAEDELETAVDERSERWLRHRHPEPEE